MDSRGSALRSRFAGGGRYDEDVATGFGGNGCVIGCGTSAAVISTDVATRNKMNVPLGGVLAVLTAGGRVGKSLKKEALGSLDKVVDCDCGSGGRGDADLAFL